MKTRLILPVPLTYLLLLSAFIPCVYSQDKPVSAFSSFTIHEYKKTAVKIQAELSALITDKLKIAQEYDSNIAEISNLKQQKELNFFDRVLLKKLLKDSEDLSQQIVQTDRQIIGKQDNIRGLIDKMIPLMEFEIKQTIKIIEKENDESEDRPIYILNLQAMIREKLEFQSFTSEPLRAQIKDIKYSRSDDPDLLIEKSDFLMDQHDKLQRYIVQVESKIELLESENEIKNQARKFIDDIYTFDKDREMKLSSKQAAENIESHPTTDNMLAGSDDFPGNPDFGFRGLAKNANPLFLNTTLEISSLQINAGDDFKDIIRKLKHEKSMAQNRAKAVQKTAEDIRRLAEIKLRYSR